MLQRQTRTGTYGSWYQYYLCDFDGTIILPDLGCRAASDLLKPHPGQAQQPVLLQHRQEV